MKFSTREDIDAPIDAVFDMLCTFEQYERAAMRRGANVQRMDRMKEPGVGAEWQVRFLMRGKDRTVDLKVDDFDRPNEMVIGLSSQGIVGEATFELIALSRNRTRLMVALELRPLTLPARLLLQSLKLTKNSLNSKYKNRVAQYVEMMEERLKDHA